MQQAEDFRAECETLDALLADLAPGDWTRETQFKRWRVDDVLVHLHFWNRMADMALADPPRFAAQMAEIGPQMRAQGIRAMENARIAERGPDLRAAWAGFWRDMAARWAGLDPRARVQWVGPDMSVRSAITARQMETWAHGQELFDLFGLDRVETDRIRNIVVLGVNTFGWSYRVRGAEPPPLRPELRLTAPSGAVWHFTEPGAAQAGRIAGAAVDFARVVTQTRNIADTGLRVSGAVAREWMAHAQCFAGPPETPPAPGSRHRADPAR